MDKHVLLGVIPVDESVSRLDVEPLDCSADFGGDHFLGFLLLHLFPSLLLVWLDLRVCHDVSVVWGKTNFIPRLALKIGRAHV